MVKVIFLENLEDHKIGDVREVPDGYARNFLFKRNLAKIATQAEIESLEKKLDKLQKEEEQKVKKAEDEAKKIEALKIILLEEVNEEGHLYGSVAHKEVSEALIEKGFEINPANIEIPEPIKELGEHEIIIKVGHGVEANTKVIIKRKE